MNVLEAIALPVTSKEIDNKMFKRFMYQLQYIEPTELTLVIMIDNMSHKTDIMPIIEIVRPKFKSVDIGYANILPEDNIYEKNEDNIDVIPLYGLVSGPNMLFLNCMEYCKQFNTTLLLEVDCFLRKDFITKLSKYVEYSGGFIISGTTYDGDLNLFKDVPLYLHHLNGVALYKTGDPIFHFLIEELNNFIIDETKKNPVLAYDIGLSLMINKRAIHSKDSRWKIIFKNVIKTNYIVNLSPQVDAKTENIMKLYPTCVILHKKFIKKDVHSLQGFLMQELDL
jgi:hypothetical protein